MEDKKPENKKPIIIIIALVIIIILSLVIILITKKDDKKPNIPEDNITNKSEITKSIHKLDEKNYLVEIKNNKSNLVNLDVSVYTYNENKEILNSTSKTIEYLEIGNSSYIEIEYDENENNEYEIVIEKEEESDSGKSFTKQMEFNHEQLENNIKFTLKNNSKVDVEKIIFEIVYYKDNKIIKYNTVGYNNLLSEQMIGDILYTPQDENGNEIDFDKYEITFMAYN